MRKKLYNNCLVEERGQSVTEYALILVLMMAASVFILAVIGVDVGEVFSRINLAVSLEEQLPPGTIEVSVFDRAGNAVESTWVYAFDSSGNWAGKSIQTDSGGIALFEDMSDGTYQFLVYENPNYFWSNTIQFPRQNRATIQMSMAQVTVSVIDGDGSGVRNVYVYAYTSNERYWMGVYGRTDNSGNVTLDVPNGDYKFRAYYRGLWFWSDVTIVPDQNRAVIDTQEQEFTVTVVNEAGNGINVSGVYVYGYSENGSYTGVYGTTNGSGQVNLSVPSGKYQFRAYYHGHNYWSEVVTSPDSDATNIQTGERPFTVTVLRANGQPARDKRVYVFTGSRAYIGLSGRTNDQGEVVFNIPEGSFTFRADRSGTSYWSPIINNPPATTTTITLN
ncbi:MAG: hypothetical protein GY943_35060 [Chloroflexi bacterium]|nr:hypothetical protein [Chloroflexota bacterium]